MSQVHMDQKRLNIIFLSTNDSRKKQLFSKGNKVRKTFLCNRTSFMPSLLLFVFFPSFDLVFRPHLDS